MNQISLNNSQDGAKEQLSLTNRVDRLNMIIQKQFMSIESGYVRCVASTEVL